MSLGLRLVHGRGGERVAAGAGIWIEQSSRLHPESQAGSGVNRRADRHDFVENDDGDLDDSDRRNSCALSRPNSST